MTLSTNIQLRRRATIPAMAVKVAMRASVCLWALGVLPGSGSLVAQGAPSDSSIELQELQTALTVTQKQLATEKNRATGLDVTRKALAESLAAANSEAGLQRAAYQDLLIKMEALGVEVLNVDPKSLQQRLLKAVRAGELEREQNRNLSEQLLSLSESVVNYFQGGGGGKSDPASRMLVEKELRASDAALGRALPKAKKAPISVSRARVVSMDPEIGLIVLNVGKKGGVRVGMPLEILRTDRPIGTALVVDVRDSICGAVLNELVSESDDVKIGDRIQPKPQQL